MRASLGDYESFECEITLDNIAVTTPERDLENARLKALEMAVKVQDELIERANFARQEAQSHGVSRGNYEYSVDRARRGHD